LSSNTAMFLAFRFLCGCAASSSMSIGGGTIADLYDADERGKAMALFGLGPLLGPVSRHESRPRRLFLWRAHCTDS
jgi:MFS family permease